MNIRAQVRLGELACNRSRCTVVTDYRDVTGETQLFVRELLRP